MDLFQESPELGRHFDGSAQASAAQELGHKDVNMIVKVYGHLQKQPHRSEVVEYKETVVVDFRPGRVREA